jgi:phospholipid/cholesterol/gamma-HCH transport system substrate-binding protein
MDERIIRFRVGVVVLAAVAITCFLILLLGEGRSFFQRRYSVLLRFPQAPGVTVDTPVRKHGVLIGRVSQVELQEDGVLLTAWIDAKYKLRRNEICHIRSASLFGDAVLDFVPKGEAGVSKELIEDGDLLADGLVASNPLDVLMNLEEDMQSTIQSMDRAADDVGLLARSLNQILAEDEGQFQRLVSKSEAALDTFQSTMSKIDQLLGDPELNASLRRSLEGLPKTMDEVRLTLGETRKALASFERMSSKAERNLDNLEAFTEPLGERGEALVGSIDTSVRNLDELLSQMVLFSQAINSRESSLGKLVHDKQLYERISRATANFEDASRQILPILDDVRTFTHKIATDPRQLGVKGALDRKPLGVGIKSSFR